MERAKILIAEDQSIVALDIKSRLIKLRYEVVGVVSSGEAAIEKALETQRDLVLMDIVLKGEMDGIGAAEEIHNSLDTPLVFLTAHYDAMTLERAKVTEPFGYIIKPFEERELQSNIEMALCKNRMQRRLKESERWFATTLRSIGDAVIATDALGSIRFMNPMAERLTGWSATEALSKELGDVFRVVDEKTGLLGETPVGKLAREWGMPLAEISRQFSVSTSAISQILGRKQIG